VKLSLYVGESGDLERCLEAITAAEREGLHCALLPGTLGIDPLIALAVAASRTARTDSGPGSSIYGRAIRFRSPSRR
jgi:alkanesulfonate monooxygenase SsuD/methylene tetrahydromethanopterin reductase-like flavin-dependent oxidoreductase (luciferase family)